MEPDAVEIRVVGCLVEKQRATPDVYPLSLNALRLACNQSTNRDPVVDYDEQAVVDALRRLALRGWTRLASGPSSRARKYRQLFGEALDLDDAEQSLLAVLMLRGAQTPGELKQRSERLHRFESLAAVEEVLNRLIERGHVSRLERRPGQKEQRYEQLLGGESDAASAPGAGSRQAQTMRMVDLSMPIVPSPAETPDLLATRVEFEDHAAGARVISEMFGVGPELLRNGEGWANDFFTRFGTHNSTHVDAPYHYNSQIQGKPAETIDQLPLDWFFRPGVVLDFHGRADGDAIDAEDVEVALEVAGHTLAERDIVLVRTGCDEHAAAPDYMVRGPGVTAAATRWLFERGVRVMGIDAWGWDRPLHLQAQEAIASGRPGVFWEAHQVDLPYSQIERLANLGELPPTGFTVACFPLRLVGGSAAPARVVAIVGESD